MFHLVYKLILISGLYLKLKISETLKHKISDNAIEKTIKLYNIKNLPGEK